MARAVLHGIPVSAGIAIGKSFFLNHRHKGLRHDLVPLDQVEAEAARLEAAVDAVAAEFEEAGAAMPPELHGQVDILQSHLLICRDPKLKNETLRRIREGRMNAEWALEESLEQVARAFARLNVPYIRDRIEDVRVVAGRIGRHLAGVAEKQRLETGRGILLAYDLTPADALSLSLDRISAFATEVGGKTTHTGILARNLQIPAVVGVGGLEDDVREGELLVIDGLEGKILVEPSESELEDYMLRQRRFEDYQRETRQNAALPAETEDGLHISVLANVEAREEVQGLCGLGAEGVGLVRTEFFYIARSEMPREDELYEEYTHMVRAAAPHRVIFRTLDVGADKIFSERAKLDEPNPALGLRAIRYSLRHQDVFRRQLRAILRAAAHGKAAIMFPMISGVSELRQAKSVLNEARQELEASGIPFDPDIPVGIMIELPAAVLISDALAKESDFFSIGTNDLIQYSLGVDRGNRHVAYLHQPLHPAVVRAVKHVVDMAHKAGIKVSVCGEMAADPYCLPILLGMPVDEISVAPQAIPGIKHLVRRSNGEECRELLQHALAAPTVQSINKAVRHAVYSRFPDETAFYSSQLDNV